MASVDHVEVSKARVRRLEEKEVAGMCRFDDTVEEVSRLVSEEADEMKITEAKRDADAAETDLKYLRGGLVAARQTLTDAQEAQASALLKKQGDKVAKLQNKRVKALGEAQDAFQSFTDKLEASEKLAVDIHSAAGGCRPVGEVLNDRHGPMVTWMVLRLLDIMPVAESHMGQVIANHRAAAVQMEGKTLVDLQADFAEMFKAFHREPEGSA